MVENEFWYVFHHSSLEQEKMSDIYIHNKHHNNIYYGAAELLFIIRVLSQVGVFDKNDLIGGSKASSSILQGY